MNLKEKQYRFRTRLIDRIATIALLSCAILSSMVVLTILLFLVYFVSPILMNGQIKDLLAMNWNPISGSFGVVPMVVGSLCVSFTAVLIAYPFSVGLVLFCNGIGPRALSDKLTSLIEFMTCIPTVVYAFVSAILLVPLLRKFFEHGTGFSWLAASLTLSILILPTIVLMINSGLRSANQNFGLLTKSMGMTQAQSLVWVMVPQGRNGFVAGFVLGSARALGDTIISLMLAGNAAQFPDSMLDSIRTLTAHIALVVATDPNSLAYQSIFLCGLILFTISGLTNLGLRFAQKV